MSLENLHGALEIPKVGVFFFFRLSLVFLYSKQSIKVTVSDIKQQLHDASYDAFLTGLVFLGLANKKNVDWRLFFKSTVWQLPLNSSGERGFQKEKKKNVCSWRNQKMRSSMSWAQTRILISAQFWLHLVFHRIGSNLI
jgi:hypothetical protein